MWYSIYLYHTFLAVMVATTVVGSVKQSMMFLVLQSHQFRTNELGEYNLTVTVNGSPDLLGYLYPLPLEDENVTHIVLASYNNGSLAFIQVGLVLSNKCY